MEVKIDHDSTKNFQDGSLIVALGKLSLWDNINASTRGFCAILSRDLVAQERRRSFT